MDSRLTILEINILFMAYAGWDESCTLHLPTRIMNFLTYKNVLTYPALF